jgi:hypothetical protein
MIQVLSFVLCEVVPVLHDVVHRVSIDLADTYFLSCPYLTASIMHFTF